ncbi:MAG: branched-chain amino acid ABC transporter permease [Lachnospiraceae bacterium]|nr:branched-chain amino acid ABC transporter permease [Lachnospiraceae bacterium]
MNVYYTGLFVTFLINVLCALSVYVILKSGQISVGNAGFMAVGGYVAGILSTVCGLGIPASVAAGSAAAALCGAVVGIPALRLKGTYLVIGTISFTAMIRSIAQVLDITGGAMGLKGMKRIGIMWIVIFAVFVIALLFLFEKTRYGLDVEAVAADSEAAAAAGVRVILIKVLSFTLGAAIAGIAGGCYAHWTQYIEPGDFSTSVSTMMVLPVILGGRNRIAGAVLGAAVFTILPELLRFASVWRMVIYGVLVIAIVIVKPDGLISGRKRHA